MGIQLREKEALFIFNILFDICILLSAFLQLVSFLHSFILVSLPIREMNFVQSPDIRCNTMHERKKDFHTR